jgi:hypothetical protein
MRGNLFQLDLVNATDKHSFDAECVQLAVFSKIFEEVVEFLFSFINNIL